MESYASQASTSVSTSTRTSSTLTPTRHASFTNGRKRGAEEGSSSDGGGTSSHTTKARPMSIIDDALFNSVSSTSTLFDKRRSSLTAAADSSLIPRPLSPGARGINSVSFRAAGESIAEDPSFEYDSMDLFAGKDSPTRTRSRIPVSSVGHARVLAEESGSFDSPSRVPATPEAIREASSSNSLSARYSMPMPGSPSASSMGGTPSRRSVMLGGIAGGTTKVLSDLVAGVENAKRALENTKSQLRASQRTVAVLTRQTEDLKEGRDRLRLENEGLNNVVARKERLLQEVLERARKAEAEASMLKTALKNTTSETKKSLKDMEATMTEATFTSQKAESEYNALKDSVSGMMQSWKREVQQLRDEVQRKEDEWAREREQVALKYKSVLKLQQAASGERLRLETIKTEQKERDEEFVDYFRQELATLRDQFSDNAQRSSKAEITADYVAGELARIRGLMRQGNDGQLVFETPPS